VALPLRFRLRYVEGLTHVETLALHGDVAAVSCATAADGTRTLTLSGESAAASASAAAALPLPLRARASLRRLLRGGGAPREEAARDVARLVRVEGLTQAQLFFTPRPAAAPSSAAAPSAPPRAPRAADVAGVYTAPYGPHGYELIHVRHVAAEAASDVAISDADSHADASDAHTADGQPLPPGLAWRCGRLEGFKLSGDPNVPAGHLSWVAPLPEATSDGDDDGASASASASAAADVAGDPRPVVAFTPEGAHLGALSRTHTHTCIASRCIAFFTSPPLCVAHTHARACAPSLPASAAG
jgi:hypothetical protein